MFCSIYISFFSAFFNLYGIRLASILSAITFPLIEIENISHERTFLCYDDITEIMLKIIEVQNPNFRMVIMNLVINFLFHFTFIFKHILSCLMYHFFFLLCSGKWTRSFTIDSWRSCRSFSKCKRTHCGRSIEESKQG